MKTEYIVVMDDQAVNSECMDEDEIPAMLDSGFVSSVLKIVNGEIRYAVIDWEDYKVEEWKKPERMVDQT